MYIYDRNMWQHATVTKQLAMCVRLSVSCIEHEETESRMLSIIASVFTRANSYYYLRKNKECRYLNFLAINNYDQMVNFWKVSWCRKLT